MEFLNIFPPLTARLWIDLPRLIFSLVLVILSLRIVWRVEKKLDTFFKLITIAFLFIALRYFLWILEDIGIVTLNSFLLVLELIPSLLMIVALIVMNNLINTLDRGK